MSSKKTLRKLERNQVLVEKFSRIAFGCGVKDIQRIAECLFFEPNCPSEEGNAYERILRCLRDRCGLAHCEPSYKWITGYEKSSKFKHLRFAAKEKAEKNMEKIWGR